MQPQPAIDVHLETEAPSAFLSVRDLRVHFRTETVWSRLSTACRSTSLVARSSASSASRARASR